MSKQFFEQLAAEQNRLGLCTDEADWKGFRKAVRLYYRSLNKEPVPVFKVRSPYVGVLVLADLSEIPLILEDDLLDLGSVKRTDYARMKAAKIRSRIRPFLNRVAPLATTVARYHYNNNEIEHYFSLLRDMSNVRRSIAFSVPSPRSKEFTQARTHRLLAKYNLLLADTARERIFKTEHEVEADRCAGVWFPTTQFVLVCDRPERIAIDDRNRLHSYDKPALRYRDGWSIYAIHGTIVPRRYIELSADSISPYDILAEQNADVRAAVISKVGLPRMLRHLTHSVVSCGSDGKSRLLEVDLNGRMLRMLHLVWTEADGQHETVLVVPGRGWDSDWGPFRPANPDDFEQVRLWTFGLRPSEVKIVAES